MKKSLAISLGFHLFIFSMIFLSTLFTKSIPPMKVYHVRIIVPPAEEVRTERVENIEKKPVVEEKVEDKKAVSVVPKKKSGIKSEIKKKGQVVQSPIRLDAPDFSSPFYVSLLYTKVLNNWLNPNPQAKFKLNALVYFRIRRDGKLAELKLEKRSGSPAFDEAAINAIRLSEPFPPLPDEFNRDVLGVYFEFEHLPE